MAMKEFEEELQNRIESGGSTQGADADAYRRVFSAIGKEPAYKVPVDFAGKVMSQIDARRSTSLSRDYIWFGIGIVFLVISFLVTLTFVDFRIDFGFLKVMADYKGLAVFGIAFILALNWLDKKLLFDKSVHEN